MHSVERRQLNVLLLGLLMVLATWVATRAQGGGIVPTRTANATTTNGSLGPDVSNGVHGTNGGGPP